MNARELNELFGKTVRSVEAGVEQFEHLAGAMLEAYSSQDPRLRRHIQNRLKQIETRTGEKPAGQEFDLSTARLVIADEVGFAGWDELVKRLSDGDLEKPILFQYTVAAMVRGDFSALEEAVGSPERFSDQIIEWFENGFFDDEPQTLAEVFSAACMLGHPRAAEYLLEKGIDPLAGTRTGLNGFHYAASSGRLEIIKLLIARAVPMEVKNMYGGTVLEQAMWSAVNEFTESHAAIIEALIEAGAYIEPGTLEWWNEQDVPSLKTKAYVAQILRAP